MNNDLNREELARRLEELRHLRIPFGKYGPDRLPPAGALLIDLPLEYLAWFKERGGGFPQGRLGELLDFVYEVKACGAEEIFRPLRKNRPESGDPLRRPRKRDHRFGSD